MKRILLALFLAAVATASASPLPSFKHLPNYMVMMQCEPFSKSALAYLHAQGIPAHRLTYGWAMTGGHSGYHAAVLFQWEGRFYFIDNQHQRPVRVGGKTDLACVRTMSGGFGCFEWMTDEQDRRVPPRKMADLFAPAPAWLQQLQVGK